MEAGGEARVGTILSCALQQWSPVHLNDETVLLFIVVMDLSINMEKSTLLHGHDAIFAIEEEVLLTRPHPSCGPPDLENSIGIAKSWIVTGRKVGHISNEMSGHRRGCGSSREAGR